MKKFTYQLETVLAHRKLLEEAEQLGLAKISRLLSKQGELLESQLRQQRSLAAELAEKELRAFDINESVLYREYLAILEMEIQRTLARIQELEKEFIRKREELVRASRNRKVLDTHRDRELGRFLYEEERSEQKKIDEMTVIRRGPGREE